MLSTVSIGKHCGLLDILGNISVILQAESKGIIAYRRVQALASEYHPGFLFLKLVDLECPSRLSVLAQQGMYSRPATQPTTTSARTELWPLPATSNN